MAEEETTAMKLTQTQLKLLHDMVAADSAEPYFRSRNATRNALYNGGFIRVRSGAHSYEPGWRKTAFEVTNKGHDVLVEANMHPGQETDIVCVNGRWIEVPKGEKR